MLSVQHASCTRLVPGRAPLMCACAVGVYAIEAEVAVFAELVLDDLEHAPNRSDM